MYLKKQLLKVVQDNYSNQLRAKQRTKNQEPKTKVSQYHTYLTIPEGRQERNGLF